MCYVEASAGNGHAADAKLSCLSWSPIFHVLGGTVFTRCQCLLRRSDISGRNITQLAVKSGVNDRFSVLEAHMFSGCSPRAVPFDTTNMLMAALNNVARNHYPGHSVLSTHSAGAGEITHPACEQGIVRQARLAGNSGGACGERGRSV